MAATVVSWPKACAPEEMLGSREIAKFVVTRALWVGAKAVIDSPLNIASTQMDAIFMMMMYRCAM